MEDLYQILQVPLDAGDDGIRSAYRALARKYHPDIGEGSSRERFQEVQQAYEVLGHPARRAEYDRSRRVRRSEPAIPDEYFPPVASTAGTRQEYPSHHIDLRNFVYRPQGEPLRPQVRGAPVPFVDEWDKMFDLLLRFF